MEDYEDSLKKKDTQQYVLCIFNIRLDSNEYLTNGKKEHMISFMYTCTDEHKVNTIYDSMQMCVWMCIMYMWLVLSKNHTQSIHNTLLTYT